MEHSRRTFLRLAGGTGLTALGTSALAGTAAAARYDVYTDLRGTANVTGSELDDAILQVRGDCPLVGLGDVWVDVGQQESMNAVYMAAHAAWESAWGTSNIAQDKKNLYGWGAYDSDPYDGAKRFSSFEACIRHVMPRVRDLYLTEGGTYYEGPHLAGMNEHYATDTNWANGIAGVMNSLADHIDFGSGGGGSSYAWPYYSNGDQGEGVYTVQYLLQAQGYDLTYLDGIYGSEVETAVEDFQATQGLSVDGVVGPNTWEALYVPVVSASDDPYWATYAAQHNLRDGHGYSISVDGYYGSETKSAVESFQSGAGLAVDGVVGRNTWRALVATL
ncbi:Peptidoglycan-binding (PGRP) domain of peptidoglycan hydrolases-containing protein [Halogranum rubrum]|uniref:Peptidoglycan-binding (PGRP) domain of peptidoglycan hydrolases-containing protein n=1 Tax=Halogranum rubrum TaxID=553466 RepID=A0A1I4IAU3_9EURY|nr:peptidoglycan-binding protein [Halogranum rubrum]SFL51217.1 Peptidoglycan-binding (PGRP) domain of peptidoglycan hydrolases-containing protein [Halogranum rubrum]